MKYFWLLGFVVLAWGLPQTGIAASAPPALRPVERSVSDGPRTAIPPQTHDESLFWACVALVFALGAVFLVLAGIFWVYSALGIAEFLLYLMSGSVGLLGGSIGLATLVFTLRKRKRHPESRRKQHIVVMVLSAVSMLPGLVWLILAGIFMLTAA